jgi:hypothetical protein
MTALSQLRQITPLLIRRLRIDLRAPAGHLNRAAATLFLMFTIFAVVQSGATIGAPGLMVYSWIVWMDSLIISMGGVTVFASLIAAEREQGTLPLLRLTGSSPLSLILGQGFSGVVLGCLLLAVQVPLVVLTITLGGVLWSQVLATFLALLAHLVLCAGLGLFWSVVCLRANSASTCTLLSIIALWKGTWLFRLVLDGLVSRGWILPVTETALDAASLWIDDRLIWNALGQISTSFGGVSLVSEQFWWSLGIGALLLLAAAGLVDRRPLETPAYSPIVLRLWKSSGSRAWQKLAIAGKDYRQFMGGMKGLIARIIVYPGVPLAVLWAIARLSTNRYSAEDVWTTVFWFAAVFLVLEAAAVASRVFRNEFAELTWSSLAVLPRARPLICLEKIFGALLGLLPGLLICGLTGTCSMDVQDFFLGRKASPDQQLAPFVATIQPVLWISVTGLSALVIIGASPTISIFFGLLAIIVQWCLMLFGGMLIFGTAMSFRHFAMLYLGVTSLVCTACLIAAAFRLRSLTQKS